MNDLPQAKPNPLRRLLILALIASGPVQAQIFPADAPATDTQLNALFDGSSDKPVVSAGPARKTDQSAPGRLSPKDDAFLDDVSHRAFRFFQEHSDPATGLALDRATVKGAPVPGKNANLASIASTGFGLTGLCMAAERKWLGPKEAREKARTTLDFLMNKAYQQHGWFYHFMDATTGERRENSEVSTIDTALLMGGVLSVRQCFSDDPEIVKLATGIYERIDFPWMLKGNPPALSMGWTPENGFINGRWDIYSEHAMLELMAIGSPTHPIPASVWDNWKREPVTYGNYSYYAGVSPLFIHQYSQAYVDFRGKTDRHGIDYFQNSVNATLAQRQFFIDVHKEFPTYDENIWGLTSSDGPKKYMAWGAPPRDPHMDGTVVPCAPGGSLMFTPKESISALETMKERYGDKAYGRYGFADAFNPATGWVDRDVLGIDQGITMLSAENLRSGDVWTWFMQNPEIGQAMNSAGFTPSAPAAPPAHGK